MYKRLCLYMYFTWGTALSCGRRLLKKVKPAYSWGSTYQGGGLGGCERPICT